MTAGSEAIVTIVMRMRDEASAQIKAVTQKIIEHRQQLRELATGAAYVGVTFVAMGAALKQINSPLAQTAGGILTIVGGILSFVGTSVYFIMAVGKIINVLRSLAVVQAIVKALTGPVGWAQLGIGLGVAAVATAGIYAMTRSQGGSDTTGGGIAFTGKNMPRLTANKGTTNVTVQTAAVMGNQQQARQLARDIQKYNREDQRLGR